MSGICGLLRLDGGPAEAAAVSAMGNALAHRGGDSSGVHTDGPAGLAACVRHEAPESIGERQPLVGPSGAAIVADARIDNRDELIAALGHAPGAAPSDAGLILAAYEKWGPDAVARLIGDFAFAIWDPARRRLLCARDPLGVRPLCYARVAGRLFALASESKALLRLEEMGDDVDEQALLSYLDGRDLPQDWTFYAHVRRLPPGHRLVAEGGETRLDRYWQFDPHREVRMSTVDDYVDAFRSELDRAVGARLRSVHPVGAMLSGGLDSSSVAVTARGIAGKDLPVFSYRFDGVPASDEREYQDHILARGGLSSHVVRGDELDPFMDFDRILFHADEPTGAGNLFLHWAAWRQAREVGVPVMLDGFFGDSAVSYGDDLLPELLRSGSLVMFVREADARRRLAGGGRRMLLRIAAATIRTAIPHLRLPGTKGLAASPRSEVFVPLNAEAARRLPPLMLSARVEGYRTVRRRHFEDVTHEAYTPVFEVLNKAAAGAGTDVRFPFADRRLIELALALPAAVKQRRGLDRWVLREAMAGRLPEPVRLRTDKADLLPNLAHTMRGAGRKRLAEELEDPDGPLARFVDRGALTEQLQRFDAGNDEIAPPLWTAACASAWLRARNAPGGTPKTQAAGREA